MNKIRIHYLQHVPFEGLGYIEYWINSKGHAVTSTQFFLPYNLPKTEEFDWLIIMGGPMSVNEEEIYPWLIEEKEFIKEAINSNKIVIGICLGAQLIAEVLGAKVYKNPVKEIGWFPVYATNTLEQSLFKEFPA